MRFYLKKKQSSTGNYMKIIKLTKRILIVSLLTYCALTYAGTLTPADAKIVAAIHAKFAANPTVSNLKVQVTSHDGVVALSGKLIEISESVPDVKDVKTPHLKLKESKHSFKDTEITSLEMKPAK
jgi:hypothetical protein